MVTGLFHDRSSAERAYSAVADRGYNKDDVTLMMSDDTRKRHFADTETELGSKAAEGAWRRRRDRRHHRRRAGLAGGRGRHHPGLAWHRPGGGRSAGRRAGWRRQGGGLAGGLVGALIGAKHSRRTRQALRRRHQEWRHPDGREAAQHRGRAAHRTQLDRSRR
ncbi:hypothetical protein LP420_23390 [Massilia sp. B-10]|nr:hypothetical protein LP420_23390 [Massilia sp. B-10]